MSFKDDFLKLKPGPQREALVYAAAIKQGPPKKLIPITVKAPDGSKIIYKTMPDYLTIDGLRVPISGATAQKLADAWGMQLPTTKMSKQIWQAADTKIMPTPLSAGGHINGKYYSGKEVVQHKIGDSDSSIAYNQMIDKELEGKTPTLVAGHMKDIVQPADPNKLGLYGWYDKSGKPTQYSHHTPHDIKYHTEYGAGARFIDDAITVINPDGSVNKSITTIDQLQKNPTLFKTISVDPGVKRYNVPKTPQIKPADKPKEQPPQQLAKNDPQTEKPQSGALRFLQRIDKFLSGLGV